MAEENPTDLTPREKKLLATRIWKAKNKQAIKEYNAAYHETHKEESHARNQKWRKNNPEGMRKNNRNWNVKNSDRRNEFNKLWQAKNPSYRPDYMLKKYSITLEEYELMFTEQKGLCAVCGEPSRRHRLGVDHDHTCCAKNASCGKCIRGLVCHRCNLMMGNCDDNPNLLERMIKYLRAGGFKGMKKLEV